MAVLFPPLEPIAEESGREFKLGRFPNRRYEPRNGGSATVRGFGSLSFGMSLQISFGVVTDQEVSDVWLAWDAAKGEYGALELPEKFFFGISANLLAKIPDNIEWHFAPEKPQYSSVGPGYSRLEPITFIGQLAVQYPSGTYVAPAPSTPNDGSWVGAGQCDQPWEPPPPPPL